MLKPPCEGSHNLYFRKIQKHNIGAQSLQFCGHIAVRKASPSRCAELCPLVGYAHSGFNTQTQQVLLPIEMCPSRKLQMLQPDTGLLLIKIQTCISRTWYTISGCCKKFIDTKGISKVKPLVGLMRSLYGTLRTLIEVLILWNVTCNDVMWCYSMLMTCLWLTSLIWCFRGERAAVEMRSGNWENTCHHSPFGG